ncbi:hypothetical protein BIFDEN_02277 [Bifidobacterium dentium ATCC 27678]|nr:hypothetical protein BIFDEN_02277 [Bifidobacterium dentium ATCC 27678]
MQSDIASPHLPSSRIRFASNLEPKRLFPICPFLFFHISTDCILCHRPMPWLE